MQFTLNIFPYPPRISYELLEARPSVLYNPLIPYNAFLTLESRETHFKEKRISGYP